MVFLPFNNIFLFFLDFDVNFIDLNFFGESIITYDSLFYIIYLFTYPNSLSKTDYLPSKGYSLEIEIFKLVFVIFKTHKYNSK
jgi:hypothetical protein